MKKIAILSLAAILNISCSAQEKNKETLKKEGDNLVQITEPQKGTWKVDKEFDENGNLIRYDSIYSWSSTDKLGEFSQKNPDSLLKSFQSKFYRNFSGIDNRQFEDLFADDSLFAKRFFDDDFFDSEFGEDFMDIDRIRKRMENMQQRFLEKYQSEFENPDERPEKEI